MYAIPMMIFGLMHLANGGAMSGMVPSYLPFGIVWVYITGIALIAAAISIIIGKKDKLSALLLGIMLVLFALTIHLPGTFNPETAMMSMPMLLKDTALAGASFLISGLGND